ncbi:O-antigen ligase family protein [Clostridium perfringens]|uniref:O-antigen ligase family protein n=2 Tax=Clostridium perfringens TaxID=1502 RepID=UPI00263E6704|nr:O-antigen ligase family protein [Clostridium perfringens]
MLICGLGIKILYQNLSGWQNFLIKIFYIFSSIHVIATIIQKIFPNIITSVYSKILPYSILETNIMFLKIDNYSGITGQTGVNAFYISIFLAIVFSKFLFEKQKVYINVFFIVLGFYALILTGKRGLLISNIICFFIIILIMKKKKRKNLSKIVLAIISFIIASIVIYNSNDMKVILLKFKLLEQSGDITNGRSIIWSLAIENFKNNFFLGTGISSTAKIIGEYAHNIYIQLLSDLGILGFLSFVFTFIFSLIFSIKLFRSIYNTIKISDDILRNIAISIYIQILFIIYGFTGNPLYGVMFFIPYLINIALIYTYKYELKGEEY